MPSPEDALPDRPAVSCSATIAVEFTRWTLLRLVLARCFSRAVLPEDDPMSDNPDWRAEVEDVDADDFDACGSSVLGFTRDRDVLLVLLLLFNGVVTAA